MKKILSLLSIVGLVVLVLAGCEKGKTAEEAGEMFIDRLIYNKTSDDFAKTFENGEELDKLIKESNISFTKDFIEGFNSSANSSFSKEKVEELGKNWKTKVEKETKYKIKNVEEKKDQYTVHYEINGLNFVEAYRAMLNTVMEKIIADPTVANDENKANQLVMDEMIKAISEMKVSEEPVEVKLNFIKKGSKYTLSSDEEENVKTIFIATYLGQTDNQALDNEIEKIAKEMGDQLAAKMATE